MALLGLIFAVNVYRAATQSITHDEALTYELFVAAPWTVVFNAYDPNHHVLHTILSKVTVGLLGVSAILFAPAQPAQRPALPVRRLSNLRTPVR